MRPGDEFWDAGALHVVPHPSDMVATALELERERAPRCDVLIVNARSGEAAPCALWRGHDGAHNGFTRSGRSLSAGAAPAERLARLRASQARVLHDLRESVAKVEVYGLSEVLEAERERCVKDARRLACSWEQVGAALGVSADEAFAAWKDIAG